MPRDVNYKAMKQDLANITGVKAVHSLNVWSLTMDKVAVGVHLAIGECILPMVKRTVSPITIASSTDSAARNNVSVDVHTTMHS